MHITLKFYDTDSLTVEEVVQRAVRNYGSNTEVEIMPDSTKAHDMIYFGIQQIITNRQLELFYDNKLEYHKKLQELRNETLYKIQEILSQVIIDNESKVA